MLVMVLTFQNACSILGLDQDADPNSVLTRYRELAIKWHPEKHNYSIESQKKFIEVSHAYKRLKSGEFHQNLSMNDCLSMFQKVVFNRSVSKKADSSDDDNIDNTSDDSDSDQPSKSMKNKQDSKSSTKSSEGSVSHLQNGVKNVTDSHKDRHKAEKRRAKKKRQKERKKLEKEQKSNSTIKNENDERPLAQEKIEVIKDFDFQYPKREPPLEEDTSSASAYDSFTKVVNKRKRNNPIRDQPYLVEDKSEDRSSDDDEVDEIIESKVYKSRMLAIEGNKMAETGEYATAIRLFTEAIDLNQTDFRFFGNRSYCYDLTGQYDKALMDAEMAVTLNKEWPKGYFRKGRALAGLKRFSEAEKAFVKVLELDKTCKEAADELIKAKIYQLVDIGFSYAEAEAAVKKCGSVQATLKSHLVTSEEDITLNDLHISDYDSKGLIFHRPAVLLPPASYSADMEMDPSNPEGRTSLWIGNIQPSVTEAKLKELFSKYGQIVSVRLMSEKFCAFVNYNSKEGASRAMQELQGLNVDGKNLLIKFPSKPPSGGLVAQTQGVTHIGAKFGDRNTSRVTGPVNGNECSFWRTTGCLFGNNCKFQHYPENKGIDKKPWQK